MGGTDSRYSLQVSGPAARQLADRLPEKVATAAYEFITGALLEAPRRVGKPLREPLVPYWCARRGTYRIIYLIDDERESVVVTSIRHRADAYRG